MVTLIHILCPNFMEIVRQEVGDTMRCFGDKKLCKMLFFCRHFVPVWQRA